MCAGQKSQRQYCAATLGGEETKIQIREEGVCTEFRKKKKKGGGGLSRPGDVVDLFHRTMARFDLTRWGSDLVKMWFPAHKLLEFNIYCI